MDSRPLIVDFHDSLEEVSLAAMRRSNAHVYDHIMVTLQGMYCGVITVHDLLERIAEQGIRYAQQANPLTGLPGNALIRYQIERAAHSDKSFAVLYLDLDNFKVYNDVYGFDRGDEVLKLLAEVIQSIFGDPSADEAFIGHLGGDDFVVVVDGDVTDETLKKLLDTFDTKIPEYYDDDDRQRGYMYAANRRGEMERFAFVSLSVAVVTEENGPFDSYHAIAKHASEVKKRCKCQPGSCFFFDRRTDQSSTPLL
jgi:diguanylate cyclase (GGDEF)-like protein